MKKKIMLYLGVALFLFIILFLTNMTILNNFLPQIYPCHYCSDKCVFSIYEPAKGRDPLGIVIFAFDEYKSKQNKPNLMLYRRFYRKWWQFWNWRDFLTNPRWDVPYSKSDENT